MSMKLTSEFVTYSLSGLHIEEHLVVLSLDPEPD